MSTTGESLTDTFDEGELLPDPLPADPFPLLQGWFDEAVARAEQPNPNGMALATVGPGGSPSVRLVLCKAIHPDPGRLVFYTNYRSRKATELEGNPRVAAVLHWDHQERQIRVEGVVTRSPAEESDAYFASRRWESRLGAWASDQSRPIESREALLEQAAERAMELGLDISAIVDGHGEDLVIPRPPHWGGYRIWADRVELWCSGVGRVHDRAAWTRKLTADGEGFACGAWEATRVQP